MSLKKIIDNNESKTGKLFDISIQILIIISIISFSLETLPNISDSLLNILNFIDTLCIIIFTIEYILRIIVADRKLHFVLSFYGIIDLLAILPFYISTGIDLRSVRIIRLLRLFRIFKLVRYNKALKRLSKAFISIKEELVLFSVSTFFYFIYPLSEFIISKVKSNLNNFLQFFIACGGQ